MSEQYYRVERDEAGCEHCDAGGTWTVVCGRGEDEEQISTSFEAREHAEDLCLQMNRAFKRGQQLPNAEAVAAVPSLAGEKALVVYFATDRTRDEFSEAARKEMGCVRTVKL
ncbi:MAG TPA: hypothetical protein VK524_20335 [Polyangiaceae bacterium]|nr:hypothetical protein [Polyangiaceae bacterium]